MNRLPLLSIALLFGLGNTAPADEKPKKGDLAKLQGTWTVETVAVHRWSYCFFAVDGVA
jgi:hypothetical protein